jgi:hypothetical protein
MVSVMLCNKSNIEIMSKTVDSLPLNSDLRDLNSIKIKEENITDIIAKDI